MEGVPDAISKAYESLLKARKLRITIPLQPCTNESGFCFEYEQGIDEPNKEQILSPVLLRVVISQTFPYGSPSFFALSNDVSGFPHQDAETGKLCLADDSRVIMDESRLIRDVDCALAWLNDAGAGRLLPDGDPYELPDFSRRKMEKELDTKPHLYTAESEDTYEQWLDRVGQWGRVSFGRFNYFEGDFPRVFCDRNRNIICDAQFAKEAVDPKGRQLEGCWFLLSSLCFHRHRPAQTYGELRKICARDGIDFGEILGAAWKCVNKPIDPCIILAGMPIPKVVGKETVLIHWQPLYIDGVDKQFRKQKHKHEKRKKPSSIFNERLNAGEFDDNKPVLWGRTENISQGTLYARGALPSEIGELKISVCGCGAIGSLVAEILARGGVRHLTLFDNDVFEIGNQCRHTLDGRHIGKSKAHTLAGRLQSCNHGSQIRSFSIQLPFTPQDLAKPQDHTVSLLESDVVIDCGLSEPGFQWLSELLRRKRIPLVSLFFNIHAAMLTVAISGNCMPCRETLHLLQESVDAKETPFSMADYDPDLTPEGKVLPELGCWHATFPAINYHVWMLVTAGVEVVFKKLVGGQTHGGYAAVIRRNEYVADQQHGTQPLVEIVWEKTY